MKNFDREKTIELDEKAFDNAVRCLYDSFNMMGTKIGFDDLDPISKEEFIDSVWFTIQVYLQNKN